MTGEIIKEFLVGLGFDVDDSSLKKFNKALTDAEVKVAALFATIQASAAGVFWGISKISEGFEQMGYEFRIISPAINKALVLRRELLRAYSEAGVNITQAVVGAVKFNMALTKVQYTLKAIASSVAVKFFPILTKQMDQFRKQLYANMPKIQDALERFVKAIFKAFEATIQLGSRVWSILSRVYDFFAQLDQKTNGWSTIILGVVAAWKLLNLSFLATPLGLLLTGLVALLALYDDFKTYQEGGESLINWAPYIPIINDFSAAISDAADAFNDFVEATKSLMNLDLTGFLSNELKLLIALKNVAVDISDAFDKIVRLVGGSKINAALDFRDKIDESVLGYFGSGNAANAALNVQNPPGTGVLQNPIGSSSVSTANTNQNVSQQTTFNIMGTADAQGTANAVTSQQYNVNRDLVRNLKGATTPAPVTK